MMAEMQMKEQMMEESKNAQATQNLGNLTSSVKDMAEVDNMGEEK